MTLQKAVSTPLISISAMILVLLMLIPVAWAQSSDLLPLTKESPLVCGPREAAVGELVGIFGERAIGRGLSENGQTMLELFKSESGSWTVIVTDTQGVSCVLANGRAWVQPQGQNDGYVNAKKRN